MTLVIAIMLALHFDYPWWGYIMLSLAWLVTNIFSPR